MKHHSLSATGLSLSQAQSVSNLCNQACRDIDFKLANINNASKTLRIGTESYIETQGNPLPTDVVELLVKKAKLHATQAFLMENIKAKDELLNSAKRRVYQYDAPLPEYPDLNEVDTVDAVGEAWGWEQLSATELNEYTEAEAHAAHYGQFIHKKGTLDRLRTELPTLKTLEWIEVEAGKKTPLQVVIHHTSEQLTEIHEQIAALHRNMEQRVNYFKAKVKNLVTAENAKIARSNADLQAAASMENDAIMAEYRSARQAWSDAAKQYTMESEETRQKEIQSIANLRINVDARFKDTIDAFLSKLN